MGSVFFLNKRLLVLIIFLNFNVLGYRKYTLYNLVYFNKMLY